MEKGYDVSRDPDYEMHESCGNVFADLGLPDPDILEAKHRIVRAIKDEMREQGLTQTAAAKRMGLTQPRLSLLLRGRTDRFTLDRLFRCLKALGIDVGIHLEPKPADREQGEVWSDYVPRSAVAESTQSEEEERLAAWRASGYPNQTA